MRPNHRLFAVRADLARRAGNIDLARISYTQALALCANDVERAHLAAQRDTLNQHTDGHDDPPDNDAE